MYDHTRARYDEESVYWDFKTSGRKAYAVSILSAVWTGVKLPPEFLEHAESIRSRMILEGTWEQA